MVPYRTLNNEDSSCIRRMLYEYTRVITVSLYKKKSLSDLSQACHCESLWIIMWCSLTRQTVHFILTRQTVHFNAEWPHLKNWFQEPSVRLPQRDCQIDRSTKIDRWCPPFSSKRLASNWNEEVRKAKFKTSDSKLQIPNLYIDLNFRTRTDCLD